jgi:hypothetical protein
MRLLFNEGLQLRASNHSLLLAGGGKDDVNTEVNICKGFLYMGDGCCCLFGWLVADGWCWFVLREEYCWLVADGWCWFVLREEYCWLVAADCWWLIRSERKALLAGG